MDVISRPQGNIMDVLSSLNKADAMSTVKNVDAMSTANKMDATGRYESNKMRYEL